MVQQTVELKPTTTTQTVHSVYTDTTATTNTSMKEDHNYMMPQQQQQPNHHSFDMDHCDTSYDARHHYYIGDHHDDGSVACPRSPSPTTAQIEAKQYSLSRSSTTTGAKAEDRRRGCSTPSMDFLGSSNSCCEIAAPTPSTTPTPLSPRSMLNAINNNNNRSPSSSSSTTCRSRSEWTFEIETDGVKLSNYSVLSRRSRPTPTVERLEPNVIQTRSGFFSQWQLDSQPMTIPVHHRDTTTVLPSECSHVTGCEAAGATLPPDHCGGHNSTGVQNSKAMTARWVSRSTTMYHHHHHHHPYQRRATTARSRVIVLSDNHHDSQQQSTREVPMGEDSDVKKLSDGASTAMASTPPLLPSTNESVVEKHNDDTSSVDHQALYNLMFVALVGQQEAERINQQYLELQRLNQSKNNPGRVMIPIRELLNS